jgi:hypothetical protein
MDAMPILPPAPINDAMAALLARSRQVMSKLEVTTPTGRGQVAESYNHNYTDPTYSESDEREPVYEQFQTQQQPRYNQEHQQPTEVLGPIDYDAQMVQNSRLPQNIKDLMIAHPIKQITSMSPQFTAEQISKITGQPIRENKPQQQQRVNENIQRPSNNPDMITLSKSDLKEMINEGIATFFKQVYDKTLTEETIKKTINVLIKEGKINVKK